MKISRKDSHLQGDKPEAEVNSEDFVNNIINNFDEYRLYLKRIIKKD